MIINWNLSIIRFHNLSVSSPTKWKCKLTSDEKFCRLVFTHEIKFTRVFIAFFKKQFFGFFYTGSICFLSLTQNVSRKKNILNCEWKKKWKEKVKHIVFVLFSVFLIFLFKIFLIIKLFSTRIFFPYFSVYKNKCNCFTQEIWKMKKWRKHFFHLIFLHIVWKKWKSLTYFFLLF